MKAKVVKKYLPKPGRDGFFVELWDQRDTLKAMIAQAAFDMFQVGDVLTFGADVYVSRSGWVNSDQRGPVTPVSVEKGQASVYKRTFTAQYIGQPVRVENRWWYRTKVADQWWLCPADVAAKLLPELLVESYGHYAVLGVPATATQDQIEWTYKKLAEGYAERNEQVPDEIVEAALVLLDPAQRAQWESGAVGHKDTVAAPWPCNGLGEIECRVEARGEELLCVELLSFTPQVAKKETQLDWNQVVFHDGGVSLMHGVETISVGQEDLPFTAATVLNKVKGQFTFDGPTVTRTQRKEGQWDSEAKQATASWSDPAYSVDWGEAPAHLEKFVGEALVAKRLQDAYESMRTRLAAAGVLLEEDLENVARAKAVPVEKLRDQLWSAEYDPEFAKELATYATDNVWGYTEDGLVFRCPSDVVILERPIHGAATYVYLLPPDLTVGGLVSAVKAMNLLDLRKDPVLQAQTGYVGFAIHSSMDHWKGTVAELIEQASDW